VYPFEIPGGWSVVGRTPLRVFDANRQQPSLFEPGDQVRFDRIDRSEFDELARKEGTE
jgi:inhibitor of KinA